MADEVKVNDQAQAEVSNVPNIEAMVEAEVAKAVAGLLESVAALREDLVNEVRDALTKLRADLEGEVTKAKSDVTEEVKALLARMGTLVAEVTQQADVHSRIQKLEEDLKKVSVKVRQNLG